MDTGEVERMRFYHDGSVPAPEILHMIGVAIMSEHLRVVANMLINGSINTSTTNNEVNDSVTFVTGTGIAVVTASYELEIDPVTFKETFYEWCDYQKRVQNSASSSAITPATSSAVA